MVINRSPMRLLVAVSVILSAVHAEVIVNSDVIPQRDAPRNISLTEQIDQILDLFNTRRLADNWPSVSGMLSSNCSWNMEQYLQGLSQHAIWAMKSTSDKVK